jgi:hypothetical protein
MKYSIKHTLALLTVFSATVVNAVDSAYMSTSCKIVALEEKMYRVEYMAAKDQNVTIQLLDDNERLVYKENIQSSSFVKKFDLSHLPNGSYQIEIKSTDYFFSEGIVLDDLAGFAFKFDLREIRKVSLVGSKHLSKDMTLYIIDDTNEMVYKETFNKQTQVHKVFNFNELNSRAVTFMLYHDDQLITEEEIIF